MTQQFEFPAVDNYLAAKPENAPDISPEYRGALDRLVILQDQGVTHFYGCQLDLVGNRDVWLSPVEVADETGYSYFQLLYVNTTPQEALSSKNLPVSLLEIDEASYKLTPTDHPGYEQLIRQLDGERQHILIRHCMSGMAYYPRVVTPNQERETINRHLDRLIAVTGLREPEVSISVSKPSDQERAPLTTDVIETIHARKYPFGNGEIYSYGMILEGDPWAYYEIFTPGPIENMPKRNLLVRVDSGCDIGQIFDDQGCDCRDQLHAALTAMQASGTGAVIHIPSQDGRGYGAATKMETEGLKRGIPVATNQENSAPMDTIAAAQQLLGEHFDIRTYAGAGRILGMLGVKSVLLQTDNRLKAEGLASGGIKVTRKATGTQGTERSREHIRAKHNHSDIYYSPDEEAKHE